MVGGFDAVSSYTRGPFFARLGAGFGINRFGGLERATLGPLKNAASATGLSANVTAETGLSYKFGALDVSPRLRLGWLGANFDRFQEAGVVAPLDVRSRSVSALAGAAEVHFAYDLVSERGRRIALLGTVGYERWFGVSGYQVEAELAGNTALPFAVRAAKPTGPGLLVGAGLAGRRSQRPPSRGQGRGPVPLLSRVAPDPGLAVSPGRRRRPSGPPPSRPRRRARSGPGACRCVPPAGADAA